MFVFGVKMMKKYKGRLKNNSLIKIRSELVKKAKGILAFETLGDLLFNDLVSVKLSMNLNKIVLGTSAIGGVWGTVDPQESVRTILHALESGITRIDTAPAYGNAEIYIGQALKEWKGTKPAINSKVGRMKSFAPEQALFNYERKAMFESVENSLLTMGIEQLDTIFLHDPLHLPKEKFHSVFDSLLCLKEKGYAKKIGLGGNLPNWMSLILDSFLFDALMEFNRLNACCTEALQGSLPFCIGRQIDYYAASPLNMGLLGVNYEKFIAERPEWLEKKFVETAMQVKRIADTNSIALSSLAHRFLFSLDWPLNVVIGASNRKELEATLGDVDAGPLPESLVHEIRNCTSNKSKVNESHRYGNL